MSSRVKRWLKYGFKAIVILVCFALFLVNSWETFKIYNKGHLMESVSIKSPTDGMPFPSIVICPILAYKNASKVMLSIEDYEENTVNPEEYVQYIAWMLTGGRKIKWVKNCF